MQKTRFLSYLNWLYLQSFTLNNQGSFEFSAFLLNLPARQRENNKLNFHDLKLCSDSALIQVYILLQAKYAFGVKFSRVSVKQSPHQSYNGVLYSALKSPKQCESHSNTQIYSR